MLDALELADRLRAAMDLRETPILSSEFARRMGVSKQAVYEWRTTGRIAKKHLDGIAKETGLPLEYFLESNRGSSPTTKMIWRRLGRAFAKVAVITLLALPPFPVVWDAFSQPIYSGLCIMLNRLRRYFVTFLTVPDVS